MAEITIILTDMEETGEVSVITRVKPAPVVDGGRSRAMEIADAVFSALMDSFEVERVVPN